MSLRVKLRYSKIQREGETEREGETKTGSKRGAPPSPALWSGVKGWRWEEGRAGEG